MAKISIVVPVYKAEDCLDELYRRLEEALRNVSDNFEIILVEDGSDDGSWDIILKLSRMDKRVKGIRLSRNFGQHYAITAGFDHCDGDWVVVMDCDLQDPPEDIPRLYQKAKEGYEVVVAKRIRRKDSFSKCLSSRFFYRIFNYLTGTDYDWRLGNFRIISRKVVVHFTSMRERLRFFGGLVDWMGFPTAYIDVEHAPRFKGRTAYNFRKLCYLATDIIVAYSDKPLRLTIYLGFSMASFAFVVGCYFLFRALKYGSVVTGWSSLIVSLYFIGGVITFTLGIIGIYLSKTFDETKKRPLYIINKLTFDERK